MTQIDRHPLIKQAYDVCIAIEECGASVELTNAVTKASALLMALDKFIPIERKAPLGGDASHKFAPDAKFGGELCTECGALRGSTKAHRECRYSGVENND